MVSGNSVKGQASIDMLVSYGVAILIIAAAIYVVLSLGVLNSRIVPQYCDTAPSFSCSTYSMSTNGLLTLVMAQATGSTVNITGIACATLANSTGTLGPAYGNYYVKSYSSAPYYYPNNQLRKGLLVYSSNATRMIVQCYKSSGIAKGTLGTSFSGEVWINYTIPSLPGHNVQQIITVSTPYTAKGPTITTTTSTTSTIPYYAYGGGSGSGNSIGSSSPSGYADYLCGAGSNFGFESTSFGVDYSPTPYSVIGSESHYVDTCSASTEATALQGGSIAIVEVGVSAPGPLPGFTTGTTGINGGQPADPFTIDYTSTDGLTEVTFIIIAGPLEVDNIMMPTGCSLAESETANPALHVSGAYLVICTGQGQGDYQITGTTNDGGFGDASASEDGWVVYTYTPE